MLFQVHNRESKHLFSRIGIQHYEEDRPDFEKFRNAVITPTFPKLDKSCKILYRNSLLLEHSVLYEW